MSRGDGGFVLGGVEWCIPGCNSSVCGGVGVWVFSVAGDVYVMCVTILGETYHVCVVRREMCMYCMGLFWGRCVVCPGVLSMNCMGLFWGRCIPHRPSFSMVWMGYLST
jgi:hypothetical protein